MEFYFSGTIERIIFENPSNFFRILLLDIEDTDAEDFEDFEIIVTGSMADVMEGEDYTFWGSLVQHPKYGQQLKISRYERAKPSSKGLVKYFSSDHFKGIGVKTAQKIVQLYGEDTEDTIDKILAEPEKLTQINGLAAKNREAFVAKLRLNYGTEMVLAKLAAYGIPNKLAFQIQDTYKEETLDIVEKYPYQLVEDIQGIGFKIADHLAEELGIQSDAPERFRAGLVHTLLTQSMERGDTYVEARDLLEHTIELLESSRQVELNLSLVADELAHLIEEDKVQNVETKIFENSLFFAEEGIKSNLVRLLEKGEQDCFDADEITAAIQQVEENSGITYDSIQKEAIRQDYNHESEKLDGVYFVKGKFDVFANVISQLSGMIVFLVAFGGGMYLVFGGHTTIGSVTAIVQLVNFVVMPLNEIGMGMSKFREGQATLNSFEVKDVIELQTGKTKEYFDDVISFSNVDFSYPNAEEKIFNNLSLQIKKGEKIAIVGMSGSGKSTLLNLLLRFYDVTSGYISIDNQDLQAISAESLYNLMTIVQQDVYIFDDTLKANITLSQSFTEDDIKKAVQQSGLESYILENELGLQTSCGENGSNLSGGERQRLSIARALIRKTPILLLDEATSSLDNKVTTEIENSILEIQDLTVLVVTHKLNKSMLKKYNRILFMKNGVIVEDGSFDNLMDRKGEFYKLV